MMPADRISDAMKRNVTHQAKGWKQEQCTQRFNMQSSLTRMALLIVAATAPCLAASPAAAGDHCDKPLGVDCNSNGVADACDIDDCESDPACDDCNLNDIPDGCDITAGNSLDADLNGVPDECVFFDGEGVDDDWGTPENWDDDEVPNGLGANPNRHVTLLSSTVNLDLEVEIDTCRIIDGSILNVGGDEDEDFEIEEAGGMLLASETFEPSCLRVANMRQVQVDGPLRISGGGLYEADPNAATSVMATLMANGLTVESTCGDPLSGAFQLSDQMSGVIMGDAVLDASRDCAPPVAGSLFRGVDGPSASGGKTPPIITVTDAAQFFVSGNLILRGFVQLVHTSTTPLVIGGDFVNESTCSNCVRFEGPVIFDTLASLDKLVASGGVQTIEVSSTDAGPETGSVVTNTFDQLEVAAGATVDFVDAFSNTTSGSPEAIYIGTLTIRDGASVTIRNCSVYYHSLINEGGTINTVGNGIFNAAGASVVPVSSALARCILAAGIFFFGTVAIKTRQSHQSDVTH